MLNISRIKVSSQFTTNVKSGQVYIYTLGEKTGRTFRIANLLLSTYNSSMLQDDRFKNLKLKIKNFPSRPGVYQFKNRDGGVIYVGKAKNLRNRIRQYFSGNDGRPQVPNLLAETADATYTVVNNELESLYLENTVIKQYLPKYNILLRDDKNYAFIKIDYATQIPQITIARKINSPLNAKSRKLNADKFFGPYSAAYKIRNALNLTRKIFPYCSAAKVGGRPCFYYYLHRCPGVCVGKITLDEYRLQLKKIEDFLAGNTGKVKKELESEMRTAAAKKQFEKAARLRDQRAALALLEEKQAVILPKKVDWDIVSTAFYPGYGCINLFKVRGGKLLDKDNFIFALAGAAPGPAQHQQSELLKTFCEQYYLETTNPPKEIFLQAAIENPEVVKNLIKKRFAKSVNISQPKRGKTKELAVLGAANAAEYLNKWLGEQAGNLDKISQALEQLREILKLPSIPKRIECYDISNTQGTNAVGSMVVFQDGLPKKSEYRKFKIRGKNTPDDFRMMKEMLERRLTRLPGAGTKTSWPKPDLIIIDGGKGQLNSAVRALTAYGLQFAVPAIGLAKRIEEIFLPNQDSPIVLAHDQPGLQLLQRLRDEAHRFGITFHRDLRSKQAVKSALDGIPGIGPKTKKLLKAKFGTIANIRKTKFEELAAAAGRHTAKLIKESL